MLNEWEMYWENKYDNIRNSVGKTNHLDELKQQSWRQFQVFMECYNDTADIIELADNIDDMKLYPMAVLTMLHIFNAETCYEEYCKLEFEETNGWTTICLNEDEDEYDSLVFYVRECDI
jgi:SH3-like domain-containing protein